MLTLLVTIISFLLVWGLVITALSRWSYHEAIRKNGLLRAELRPSSINPNAGRPDLVLIEPNGDHCRLAWSDAASGVVIEGNNEMIDYLNARYGRDRVYEAARQAIVAHGPPANPVSTEWYARIAGSGAPLICWD